MFIFFRKLLAGVQNPSHEEDRPGGHIPDEEKERTVNGQNDALWHNGTGFHDNDSGCGCLGAFFVHRDESLVKRVSDV